MCACLMWLSCDLLLVFLTTVARRDRGPMARLCELVSEASVGPLPQKAHPATHRGSRLPPLVVVVEAIEKQKEDHDVTNLAGVKLIDMAKNPFQEPKGGPQRLLHRFGCSGARRHGKEAHAEAPQSKAAAQEDSKVQAH